jgi:hypothetical protein
MRRSAAGICLVLATFLALSSGALAETSVDSNSEAFRRLSALPGAIQAGTISLADAVTAVSAEASTMSADQSRGPCTGYPLPTSYTGEQCVYVGQDGFVVGYEAIVWGEGGFHFYIGFCDFSHPDGFGLCTNTVG